MLVSIKYNENSDINIIKNVDETSWITYNKNCQYYHLKKHSIGMSWEAFFPSAFLNVFF